MAVGMKAVIDLGSNSVRLVVYQQGPHGTQHEVEDLKQTVRLSSHLTPKNKITDRGIALTVQVIHEFKRLCDAYGVTEVIGVATQAVRMAVNQAELLDRIRKETGIAFRVLSGAEEAYYGYLAVVNTVPLDEAVMVDVGGGSTEITYFRNRVMVQQISIPFGAVSLTRRFLRTDPPSQKDVNKLERAIRKQLDACEWLKGLRCPVVGVGGTARTIARIHQRRRHYPLGIIHGYEMWPTEVTAILDMLRSTPPEKRSEINGLSDDRADIIVAGAVMLDQVLQRVEASRLVISNKGLRDGILMEQILQHRGESVLSDMLGYSLENNLRRFQSSQRRSGHVWHLTQRLYAALVEQGWWTDDAEVWRWLRVAALLQDLGRAISIYNTSKHTFYLILQVSLFGISHRDRVLAAAIAAYKTSKRTQALLANYQEFLEEEDLLAISKAGVLLGLVRSLDRTGMGNVRDLHLIPAQGAWKLCLDVERPLGVELDASSKWLKKWRKVFQKEIRLEVNPHERAKDV